MAPLSGHPRNWLILTALGTGLHAGSLGAQASAAKVEEQIVAPNEQGLLYTMSPKGAHLVAIVSKGSRFAVSYDGVVGPTFDLIMRAGSSIAFSPDGSRFAYTARSGPDWVVMVDGKEAARGPIGRIHTLVNAGGFDIRFTPNSKHWFFHHGDNSAGPEVNRVYWDGVVGPPGAQNLITVSPDGNRHAYIVEVAGRSALVVDGKLAPPEFGGRPQFSADGTQLYTARNVAVQGRPAQEILQNGRPIMRAKAAELFLAPAGNLVVARVQHTGPDGMDTFFLVVGGKKVPGSDAGQIRNISFSADGAHWAAVAGMPGQRQHAIVDGKVHQEYDMVDSVYFAPDGKAVYGAKSGVKMFGVVDGVELDVGFQVTPPLEFKFSKTGRVGWIGSTTQGMAIVVDGKVTRADPRADIADLSFSPDGSKFAYYVGVTGNPAGAIAVDGVPGQGTALVPLSQFRPRANDPSRFVWSASGNHAVHYVSPAKRLGQEYGWMIAGKYFPLGRAQIGIPTFTPDGKHFYWLAMEGQTETLRVMLDGKQVFEGDTQGIEPLRQKEAWDLGEGGVLTFIVQTVDGFKRVRVTPGPENGFEAYLATGKPLP